MSSNYRRLNLKRKCFARGAKRPFKRFKRLPNYVKNNPENQRDKEQDDVYDFDDRECDEQQGADVTDLLKDITESKQKELIALNQDCVRPLFCKEEDYDESKLTDALAELKYSSFRQNQKETIKRILFGRSTLCIAPTGSGKSLCYQLPALLYWKFRKYITIVVSPLISLMEDQIQTFPSALKAIHLHSGNNKAQKQRAIEQLVNGDAQVAFISPEAIVGGALELNDLRNLPAIGFVCVDEAHCLSEWSQNFRPAYLQFFRILNEQMKIKTYLGLTATATKATAFAISRNLVINPEYDVVGATTVPDNLILSVSHEFNKRKALTDLLKTPSFRILPSIIVYCNRREETESIAMQIRTVMQEYSTMIETPTRQKSSVKLNESSQSNNSLNSSSVTNDSSITNEKNYKRLTWHAEAYHAGLSIDTRKKIQRQFVKGEIRVVVATIAFGMGINKSDVRAIIHYDMPASFEAYVQEIGRAGRDGRPAQCHMFLRMDQTDLFYQYRNIYANTTDRKNLRKLADFIFKPCKCERFMTDKDKESLEKLNNVDVHQISMYNNNNSKRLSSLSTSNNDSGFKSLDVSLTTSTTTASPLTTTEHLDTSLPATPTTPLECDENLNETENNILSTSTSIKASIVKRHRACKGHELSVGIEEVSSALNLKPETVLTLVSQLQQAYPQLQIKIFSPTRATCDLFCYKGGAQMEQLAKNCPPISTALFKYKQNYIKQFNTKPIETPNKLSFDVIEIASSLGKPFADIVRMLKQTEWEIVDKTNSYRRSQARVTFKDNAFHLRAVGDLKANEIDEINNFLIDYERLYENVERAKLLQVFETFLKFAIPMSKMTSKSVRLDASAKLKLALNSYFAGSEIQISDNKCQKSAKVLNTSPVVVTQASLALNNASNVVVGNQTLLQPLNPSSTTSLENISVVEETQKNCNPTSNKSNDDNDDDVITNCKLVPTITKQKTTATSGSGPCELKVEAIRKDARAFISAHGKKEFTPRIIARIFQGISTPNYPAEVWGMNRKWWRIHLDVDFLQLATIIQEQLLIL